MNTDRLIGRPRSHRQSTTGKQAMRTTGHENQSEIPLAVGEASN